MGNINLNPVRRLGPFITINKNLLIHPNVSWSMSYSHILNEPL